MTLDQLAKLYNTPEKYEILKNWVNAHARANGKTEINIGFSEREIERELAKVKNTIDKSIVKVFK